jgi:hypothetical protein
VNGADVHVCEAGHFAEGLSATVVDALLELSSSLIGESEGDDVAGRASATAVFIGVSSVTTRGG